MPSTFTVFLSFVSNANALEKILRLLQSIAQILAVWFTASPEAKILWELRRQFALGRRYFRFFRFLELFQKAWDAWETIDRTAGFGELMLMGKWSFMGAYLGLESVTILDAMRIWPTPWAATVSLEGHKFWFYSLICSLLLGLLELSASGPPLPPPKDREKGKSKNEDRRLAEETRRKRKRMLVRRKMVSDAADLLIPGLVTTWIPTSLVAAGWASAVSSTIGLVEIWEKCAA